MKDNAAKHNQRARLFLIITGGLLLVCFVLALAVGRFPVPPAQVLRILGSRLIPLSPSWTDTMETVVLNIRLPRVLLACLVGGGLAAAGAAYQGVFSNPLASPDILGASSGASFGAALALLLRLPGQWVTLLAFAASLLAVALSYTVGGRASGRLVINLILAGMMVGALFTAGTSLAKLAADPTDQLPAITYWLMGSLAAANMRHVFFMLPALLLGLVPLLLLRWRLNLLTVGDESARAMGVNTSALRLVSVLCGTLITAAAVSVSGTIGYVGLIVPHLCRSFTGDDYRKLLPASLVGGALFLLVVDSLARTVFTVEVPLGILTALVGLPFFFWLLMRKEART
ncbi:MAG: iron ABC transporter permease [Clostridiales bacterium]|nr:iron ABC transporter permease [Clostridiales bacterium]